MNRRQGITLAGTLMLAACGLMVSATLYSSVDARETLSRWLLIAALAGTICAMALRPAAARHKSAERTRSAVPGSVKSSCTFNDVAANEQALQSLRQLQDYLKEPEKYRRYGIRMPKGVLLYGPPGTGKTLLARALAGEAGVPFFALTGSDFVEKYVGVGAGRVRELFRQARRAGKCVVFIDEIDAIGRRRDESASDERDQTLNALLSEMSGFYTGDGVIVLAATNRVDALDPALLRPGRFDRQIEVGLPGMGERLSILRLHSRGKPIAPDVNLETVAAQTISFSGASLENLLNEAAILAVTRGSEGIENQDIQRAYYKTVAGEDRPMTATVEERRIIALHEAGHALASALLSPENRLQRVSILPAGRGAAGYNLTLPPERVMLSKRHIENQICVLLAGRAAEELFGGEDAITSGASEDLSRAGDLAAAMVMDLGMAGEPAVSLKALGRACGPVNAAESCKQLLNTHYRRVRNLIEEHGKALTLLATALEAAESLSGEAATAILREALSSESQEPA